MRRRKMVALGMVASMLLALALVPTGWWGQVLQAVDDWMHERIGDDGGNDNDDEAQELAPCCSEGQEPLYDDGTCCEQPA